MGFGHAYPYFFANCLIAIMGDVLWSMVSLEVENDMEAKFLRTSNGGLSLCGDEKLAW
jgi:hypothetical protein